MNNKLFYKLKRYLTLDGYSVAPVYIQLIVLLALSFTIISIFSLYYGSFETSYLIFMDPTSIPDGNIVITLFVLLIGLIIASFVISILSSALENFIENIKKGTLPFKRDSHIVFINKNSKLFYIFDELNIKYSELNVIKEVVIILSSEDEVPELLEEIENYTHLSIFIKYGNLYDKDTYEKFSLRSSENITVLKDDKIEDPFINDNNNIKILSTIIQDKNIDFTTINLTIESNSTQYTDNIIDTIKSEYSIEKMSHINSEHLLGQLLTRSMIDVIYYKIYAQIFTFDDFELYVKEASQFITEDILLKDLLIQSHQAVLLGFIRDEKVRLNELDEVIKTSDQLIFIAKDENHIHLSNVINNNLNKSITMKQPSEIVSKKICMLGNNLKIENIFEFLDETSKQDFKEYCFESFDAYSDENFIKSIKEQNFDTIIINLDEEYTLRYILILVSLYGKNSSFINSCISIITNPDSAKIINLITGKSNVILSQRLSAQFISQLCFDDNLIAIINELTTSDGAEFNLLNTKDEKLATYDFLTLKYHLSCNNMTYIGLVDSSNEIVLNGDDIKNSKQIIVLSDGVN